MRFDHVKITGKARYSPTLEDYWIGVDTSVAVASVYLPNPEVINVTPGHTYVIADEGGQAARNPITITTWKGRILGAGIINTAYGRVTVYTDGKDWFAG